MNLLKKEFRLCLHPTAPLMILLSALILTPNYPYAVSFFYITLSIFFICLTSRENHDAAYTLTLPVSRREMVKGRMLFACCLEGMQLLACCLFLLVKRLIGNQPNATGMDANLALLGEGLLVYGLFNLIFFPLWYKNIQNVGKPFLLASAAVFLYIALASASTYVLPFVRDALDTPDPEHLAEKLAFLAAAALCFFLATALSMRLSVKRFEQVDLQL